LHTVPDEEGRIGTVELCPELEKIPLRDENFEFPDLLGAAYEYLIKYFADSAGKKAGGVLTLLVDGAHAPLIQHLTPMIVERVNRFFGYAAINRIVFRQGKMPAAAPKAERPQLRPVPKELGEGLREIADPELRHCLESLASQIAASSGAPSLPQDSDDPIPVINRSV